MRKQRPRIRGHNKGPGPRRLSGRATAPEGKEHTSDFTLCGWWESPANFTESCAWITKEATEGLLPGYNDTPDYMAQLRTYIREKLPPVREVELLPYHRMGAYKYAALGMDEPLGDTPPMDPAKTQALARQFFPDFSPEEGVLS